MAKADQFQVDGIQQGKILIQKCLSCSTLVQPPRAMCPNCHSLEKGSVESSGKGVVYSFVVSHYPQVPAFDYPLAIGLIELEEGTRLVSNVIDTRTAPVPF